MTHFLIKMSQLCIHTQPQVIFAQSSTKRKSIQCTSTCTWIKRKPWLKHHIHDEDHPKGTHHTRYHSSRGGHAVLPLFILIGMSLMIEPLFESIRSDDSIHPCLVDKSCDRLTFHVCYWMLGIHKEIPTRLISMSGKYWIDPALGVLVVIHMSKWSGRVLILTSD